MRTIVFDKLPSTNDYAKKLKNLNEDVAIIAKRQTKGRGTKGRSFVSCDGGIYLTLVKLYPCLAKDSFSIMIGSALSVVKTLRAFGINAGIKWPNDILVNNKKICGILIENVFEGESVKKAVIGIGLNVNNEISEEIKDIAISCKQILNKELSVDTLTATLIYNLYGENTFEEYRKHCLFIGEEVSITSQNRVYKAIIEDILPNGNLLLKGGEVLSSAEVTIRKIS